MTRSTGTPPRPTGSARRAIVQVIVTMLVTLVVLLGVATVGLSLVHHEVGVISTAVFPASGANRTVRQEMSDADSAVRSFALSGDRQTLAVVDRARAPIADSLDVLDRLGQGDADLAPLVERQRAAATTWLTDYAEPAARGDRPTAAEQQEAATAFDAFRTANTDVGSAIRVRNQALLQRSTQLIWITLALLVVLAVVGLLLVLAPSLRMLRWIGPPLESLQRTVSRLRGGERSARADPGTGVVEIQAVAAAVNELAAETERRRDQDAVNLRLAASVRELSIQIGSTLDLPEMARLAAEGLADHFDARDVWVRIFGDDTDDTDPGFGVRHPPGPGLTASAELLATARRMGQLAWRRRSYCLFSRGEPTDPDYLSAAESAAIFATTTHASSEHILFVPIGIGPHSMGYVGLSRSAAEPPWSGAEIEAMMSVGRDLGQAARHAILYERETYLVAQLKEVDGRKDDFVSMVSHELRTPLASIIGHLEIVRSGDLGEVAADMDASLQAVDRNASRLTTLIEDLLLLSRVEQRGQPTRLRPLDLVTVAQDVVGLHSDPARRRGVTLELTEDGPAPVLGDRPELERVLSNLVGNAVKFTSATPSTVRVALRTSADEVEFAVRDEGIGVSEREQAQIFQRFFRSAEATAQAVPGTGLGLAISRLTVEKHGGTIEVDSELGVGSTFTVRLPRLVGTR